VREYANEKNGQKFATVPVAVFFTRDFTELYRYVEYPAIYHKDRVLGALRKARPGESEEQTKARGGREIATLRVIGFSRPSILTSFLLESLILSLLGAALGIVLMLPFNGMTTGTQNQVTFSEVVFSLQMTAPVIVSAVLFALIMGTLGGFAPAWHASRRDILTALRD